MDTYENNKRFSIFNVKQGVIVDLAVANQKAWGVPALLLTDTILPEQVIFAAKVKLSIDRSTKGVGATANRNAEQLIYQPMTLSLVEEHLLNNPAISAAHKLAIGIKSAPALPTQTIPPVSTPVSQIHHVESLAHHLETRDSITGKKARPDNVLFAEARYIVGIVPPTSVKECFESVFITSSETVVRFSEADRNKNAYYYERWVNSLGQVGPWTAVFFAVIT
jgi:hypothetical protein